MCTASAIVENSSIGELQFRSSVNGAMYKEAEGVRPYLYDFFIGLSIVMDKLMIPKWRGEDDDTTLVTW